MTATELKQFYEKLYFHEIHARDKIQGRLQLSLTVLLAVGGALVFLIQNFDYQTGAWTPIRSMFGFFVCVGSVTLVCAIMFFINAFLSGSYQRSPVGLRLPVQRSDNRGCTGFYPCIPFVLFRRSRQG